MRMKVLLIFVCILVSVHGNAFEAKAICMEEIVDKRFKDLKFNGPIDVNYIFESYQEKAPY